MHLCKENYNNCLWRKTDWALDLLKLGKASKISSDLRKSWEVFRWYLEIFGWSSEIFGSVRAIFGCIQVIFGNLWRCLGAIQKSLEVFGWSLEVFGIIWVIFGNLRECSGDLRKSSEGFVWPSMIFRRFNSFISLAETNCPIFPKLDSFCIFTQSPYWKLSKLNPKLASFQKLKDNSCADNQGPKLTFLGRHQLATEIFFSVAIWKNVVVKKCQ